MKRSIVFWIAGILGMLFGLGFLLFPQYLLSSYGVTLDARTTFLTRDYGFTLFALGAIVWLMRNTTSIKEAVKAVVTGGLLFSLLGMIVSIWNIAALTVTPMHWVNLAIYVLLTVGFGILFFKKTE